jgi:hypothetical protein
MELHGGLGNERKSPVPIRPTGITFLASLQLLAAVLSLVVALAILTSEPRPVTLVFAGGMAALFACCAYGLWTLKPRGRTLQLLLAWVGLAAFPAGTMISIPVLYYLFRPSIRALFSGEPADQLSPEEAKTVGRIKIRSPGKFVRWPEQMQP